MKQIQNILVWIALLSTSTIFSLSAFAQSFQTGFDVFEEDNWELWGTHSIWNVETGHLRGRIQVPRITTELLQFKGFPGTYENYDIPVHGNIIQRQVKKPGYGNFAITLKNLGSTRSDFGIAIGRLFAHHPEDPPLFYLFFTHGIRAESFNGWRGPTPFPQWHVPRHPGTLWETRELASMELRFNRGHFQWFTDGEKRADFRDPEFSSIEIIGFVLKGNEIHVGSAWVDSFTISGSELAVSPQSKLATTWGQLKQSK